MSDFQILSLFNCENCLTSFRIQKSKYGFISWVLSLRMSQTPRIVAELANQNCWQNLFSLGPWNVTRMFLIARIHVSNSTQEFILTVFYSQLDVTDTVRTSLTQSPDTTEVSQTLRSEFSIWVERRPLLMNSHYVFTWSLTNWNNYPPKLWKLPVFVLTSTLPRSPVEILST